MRVRKWICVKSNLLNRSIQIAGSSSAETETDMIRFSHGVVTNVLKVLLKRGVTVVSTVGREDRSDPNDSSSPSVVFYWSILETAYQYGRSLGFPDSMKNRIRVVSSEKSEEEIPEARKELWRGLLDAGIVAVYRMRPGWDASAVKRQEQERLADALVVIGGGEGVEHLASLYVSHGKPVLPLDVPIGSSYGDGIGGSMVMSRKAVVDPQKYNLDTGDDAPSSLIKLNFSDEWLTSPEEYAVCIVDLLEDVVRPQVFYVRLLNPDKEEFPYVDGFFRNAVDYVVKGLGYGFREMGGSETKEAFINVEIFKGISQSSIVIADLTGLRLNCFLEAGFAFGLPKRVILTARKGTKLPFDVTSIPCHFWDETMEIEKMRNTFREFWQKNVNRPSLVNAPEII